MYKYQIIMYWSADDNCFITEVPELPGCMSDGSTPQEAINNTQTVISEWIETAKMRGQEIPEPKGKLQAV
ncbi:MAG: type II toxin-antitoxin system HicB family antitoxin [Clostridia bacterium]|nr:type II toxin-antitoxin system HicB family antitoxin [Clostridia bacterium]